MSFTLRCLSGVTTYEREELYYMIRTELGEPVLTVELDNSQLEVAFCRAIREYSHYINQWALKNRISQMLGLPRSEDFTLKYVSNSLYFEKSFAKAYSEQVGMGVNSTRNLQTDSITLTAGTQVYTIPANREVNEILWFTPSFINLFGLDAFANSNLSYYEFGASFAGHSLYYVMPLFDTLLTSQAAELRNKVRSSEYSYRITGGPNGTKLLYLYPIPRAQTGDASFTAQSTPGTVYYRYYDTYGASGNPDFSGYTANVGYTGSTQWAQGNGLVSGPADAQLDWLNYGDLNSSAKNWVQKFASAIAKQILGVAIRAKFATLKIPADEVTMNGLELGNIAKEDMQNYREELRKELEDLNFRTLLEDNANMQESIYKTLGFSPLGIYTG